MFLIALLNVPLTSNFLTGNYWFAQKKGRKRRAPACAAHCAAGRRFCSQDQYITKLKTIREIDVMSFGSKSFLKGMIGLVLTMIVGLLAYRFLFSPSDENKAGDEN